MMAACFSVPLLVAALMPPTPGVTKANFDRIKVGMVRQEGESFFSAKGARIGL